MFLFVGLGNPGAQYARHRHNIGFMVIDALAEALATAPFREKHKGLLSETTLASEKVILLKPLTQVNLSGESVGEVTRFYKIAPAQVIVFYDEIDLAPAKVRVQLGGSAAGHNGIKSLISHIGENFQRVRLGVGHPRDLQHNQEVSDYVLSNFREDEQLWLSPLVAGAARHAEFLVEGKDALFQTRLHDYIKAETK